MSRAAKKKDRTGCLQTVTVFFFAIGRSPKNEQAKLASVHGESERVSTVKVRECARRESRCARRSRARKRVK